MCRTPIAVSRAVIARVADHARRAWPDECCGLLLGTAGTIEQPWPARNLRPSPSRFLLDPKDHLAALRHARASGLTLIGIYHSHPRTAAVPSARDLREASYTELLYVICGPVWHEGRLSAEPPVRAWRLNDGRFVEVPLIREGDDGTRA